MCTDSNVGTSFAVLMYVLLPMPLLFFAGSDSSSLFSESDNKYVLLRTNQKENFLVNYSNIIQFIIPSYEMMKQLGECD
jgi:hypothetical protein